MSRHTGTDGHRTCFGARGDAPGGRSRALTREQSGPGVALHKQQRHTMPRSRNAYDPTARDRGVGRSLILHLGTSSQGHLNSKGFKVRGNQVTEWGERAKKGAVEGKGGSESVRWERAAGWLCPGDNVQRTLGLRKLCPAKRASSPSSSSILQERDSTHQALVVREHWRHQGAGEAARQ